MAAASGLGLQGGLRIRATAPASQVSPDNAPSRIAFDKVALGPKNRLSNGSLLALRGGRNQRLVVSMSVNVDDSATEAEEPSTKSVEVEPEVNPRKGLEETFAVKDLGKYECRSCGYVYDLGRGDSSYPIPAGIAFGSLPEDWRCPTCGAAKSFFNSKSVEIAGFAQNQQFGLGGNSMTEGQKSILIYGTLLFFFGLFLAGYLLQ